jgi:hypothetical protein
MQTVPMTPHLAAQRAENAKLEHDFARSSPSVTAAFEGFCGYYGQ